MHTFKVWATRPQKVEVIIGSDRYPMTKKDGDWWLANVEQAQPGTEYQYSLDGAEPVPDPRSAYQPKGVHGSSRVIDHSTFEWTDRFWQSKPLSAAVIYELHIGTFTPRGTFRSTEERLDYLVDLGVTHVEIMPVNEFSGEWGWGYDGVDLYAPHHCYGTPEDLKSLVNSCHAKGLAVLLDVVYNHFGPTGNYLDQFGEYFTEAYNTPWGSAVNLDHEGSAESRRFFIDNALMWLRDYHFDGLRLDAVHAFMDSSAVHFLESLSKAVDRLSAHLGRHFVLIAESDLNNPRVVKSREAGGFGIDAQWSDDYHHALHSVLTEEQKGYYEDFGDLSALGKALQCGFVYDGCFSAHRKKEHGRPIVGLSGQHFLAYGQNHDQIGNRAQGERFSQLLSLGKQKIAAAITLTSPFVPMLFAGEEFAASTPFQYFTHHDDPELAKNVSEGRRNEFKAFGWKPEDVPDPQDPATFQRSKLQWEELARQPHASMLDWYKQLIKLRREHADLTDGAMEDVEVRCNETEKWIVVERGSIQVVCNLASDRHAIPIAGKGQPILSSEDGFTSRPGLLEMPAESVCICLTAKAIVGVSENAHPASLQQRTAAGR